MTTYAQVGSTSALPGEPAGGDSTVPVTQLSSAPRQGVKPDAQQVPQSTATQASAAWEAVLSAHAMLMKRFASTGIFQEVSMREYDVLYTLSKCPTPPRLNQLHRFVLLSQPALSRLVDKLVERGLVERTSDPQDRRASRLSLTEEGRRVQQRMGLCHAADVTAAMTERLDHKQLAQLEALCTALVKGKNND